MTPGWNRCCREQISSPCTSFPWPLGPVNSPCEACELGERPGKPVPRSRKAFVRLLAVFNLSCVACNQNRNCSDAEGLVPDEIVTGNTSSSDLVFAMCEGEKSVLVGSFIHSAFKSWSNLSLCLFNDWDVNSDNVLNNIEWVVNKAGFESSKYTATKINWPTSGETVVLNLLLGLCFLFLWAVN